MNWKVGDEREVKPGNYVTLESLADGWAIWSFESEAGRYWALNKGSVGGDHPIPLGVQQAFFSPSPYMSVIIGPSPRAVVHGRHLYSTAKYRVVGERFLKDVANGIDPRPYDGSQIEIVVSSMPGPQSYSKMVQQQAIIEMTGVVAALELALTLRKS